MHLFDNVLRTLYLIDSLLAALAYVYIELNYEVGNREAISQMLGS